MDLTDIFWIFHSNSGEYTFWSRASETFFKIDHILGHKLSISKFKKIEVISNFFTEHNAIGLGINYMEKTKN